MPLQKDALKQNFLRVFSDISSGKIKTSSPPVPPPPALCLEAAQALSDAYDRWVKGSNPMAGPLTSIVVPGASAGLTASLVLPLFTGWGPGFLAYWTPVMFAGPGFIPVNPIVPVSTAAAVAGITAEMALLVSPASLPTAPQSLEQTADVLSTILHRWTLSLQVLGTTLAGVPSTFPLM